MRNSLNNYSKNQKGSFSSVIKLICTKLSILNNLQHKSRNDKFNRIYIIFCSHESFAHYHDMLCEIYERILHQAIFHLRYNKKRYNC